MGVFFAVVFIIPPCTVAAMYIFDSFFHELADYDKGISFIAGPFVNSFVIRHFISISFVSFLPCQHINLCKQYNFVLQSMLNKV
jgi:hypothetical protein